MFALIAIVLFVLAAFGVNFDTVNIVDIGLACVAAHLLFGSWPINWNRS
jgi:hypothetical protein